MKEKIKNDTDLTKDVKNMMRHGIGTYSKNALSYYVAELYQELMWCRKECSNSRREVAKLKKRFKRLEPVQVSEEEEQKQYEIILKICRKILSLKPKNGETK